ncbi:MAG: 2-hydroxychromene-2-carboxylate isomerase [Pseudomonadota bacterium]
MKQIDYFFSVLSPWTYFAGNRLEVMAERHGASIAYKPIDTFRVFRETGGVPLPERPLPRREYRAQELRRTSAKTGMPYHFEPTHWPTDPLPGALSIIAAAEGGGPAGVLAQALLAAVWTEQKDVADPTVIAEKCAALGLDHGALVADEAALKTTYEANTDEAIRRGVFGVPFYIVGDERFWGQDKLDDLEAHLARL